MVNKNQLLRRLAGWPACCCSAGLAGGQPAAAACERRGLRPPVGVLADDHLDGFCRARRDTGPVRPADGDEQNRVFAGAGLFGPGAGGAGGAPARSGGAGQGGWRRPPRQNTAQNGDGDDTDTENGAAAAAESTAELNDILPISDTAPYAYTTDAATSDGARLSKYIKDSADTLSLTAVQQAIADAKARQSRTRAWMRKPAR